MNDDELKIDDVINRATLLFIGANLVKTDDKDIDLEKTCRKFDAVKLPIVVDKER